VAQRIDPEAHVVYVDADPVAVAHSRQMLAGNERAAVIEEDLRRVDTILDHPDLRGLIDFDRPIAILMLAILHAIPDRDDPAGIVARLRDRIPSGSYLAVSHVTYESLPEVWESMAELSKRTNNPVTPRGRAEIAGFFTGFEVVEPGLVWVPLWHPESPDDVGDAPERSSNYVGIGRKP
jgi:hypothetical protein